MVTEYGMSASLGPVRLAQAEGPSYLGEFGSGRDHSEGVALKVDEEVRDIIEQAHNEAYQALLQNRDILDRLTTELLEKETLDHHQIAEIFKDVKKLPPRPTWLSHSDRPVSQIPPVPIPEEVRTDNQSASDADQVPSQEKTTPETGSASDDGKPHETDHTNNPLSQSPLPPTNLGVKPGHEHDEK